MKIPSRRKCIAGAIILTIVLLLIFEGLSLYVEKDIRKSRIRALGNSMAIDGFSPDTTKSEEKLGFMLACSSRHEPNPIRAKKLLRKAQHTLEQEIEKFGNSAEGLGDRRIELLSIYDELDEFELELKLINNILNTEEEGTAYEVAKYLHPIVSKKVNQPAYKRFLQNQEEKALIIGRWCAAKFTGTPTYRIN